jgi:hypothetical protein
MTIGITNLECERGDTNFFDVDLDVAIASPSTDKVWFYAKRRRADDDTDAVIKKGLNVGVLVGIVVTDAPLGKVRVTLLPADTENLADKSLLYDVQFKAASDASVRTVARGLLMLSGQITEATS